MLVPGLNKILCDFYFGYKKRLQKDVMPGLVGKLQLQNNTAIMDVQCMDCTYFFFYTIKAGEKKYFTKHAHITIQ